MSELTRRDFLGKAVVMAGALPFVPGLSPFPRSAGAAPAAGYASLTRADATFTEALVNALCPADRLTPNGVDCGLARYIDLALAGEFGAQRSSHGSLSREAFYKGGVKAVDAASERRFGRSFSQLRASDAGVLLAEVANGRVTDATVPLAAWHREVVAPLLVQASFSAGIYDKYDNNVFVKLFE